MLAPGHCLTSPVQPESIPKTPACGGAELEPPRSATQTAEPESDEQEPLSFLLILLRALGAIHT